MLISPATRASVERRVIAIEQAPIHIRGIAEPIIPWRVLDEGRRRTDVHHRRTFQTGRRWSGVTRSLCFCLAEAKVALRESGRMLALVGDAGVGKTRLSG